MRILVAVALPDRQEVLEVELPEGATLADAVSRARVAERFPELDLATAAFGVWSRPREPGALLRDGDRVEVYRPLQADPKEMRRRRVVRPSRGSRSGR